MHICVDGKILHAGQPALQADNKSYRYGDGLFETMKIVNGQIPLFAYHMQRLFAGLKQLEFSTPVLFTPEKLQREIIALCEKNQCMDLGRIRLSVSRGEGGIYEQANDRLHYLIECWPANPSINEWNENGLIAGIYPNARKSMDEFASLKSANYLPYSMAARFAKQQQWNECLILNSQECVADATIANIFVAKNGLLFTPAGNQGGVAGVMRKFLLEVLPGSGYTITEAVLTVEDILQADELFLTNAISGIRWVGRIGEMQYSNQLALKIYRDLVQTIWR